MGETMEWGSHIIWMFPKKTGYGVQLGTTNSFPIPVTFFPVGWVFEETHFSYSLFEDFAFFANPSTSFNA